MTVTQIIPHETQNRRNVIVKGCTIESRRLEGLKVELLIFL
jgi:hypothetical protein